METPPLVSARSGLTGLLAVLFAVACRAPAAGGEAGSLPGPPRLGSELTKLEDWFARSAGTPRTVALLSPT